MSPIVGGNERGRTFMCLFVPILKETAAGKIADPRRSERFATNCSGSPGNFSLNLQDDSLFYCNNGWQRTHCVVRAVIVQVVPVDAGKVRRTAGQHDHRECCASQSRAEHAREAKASICSRAADFVRLRPISSRFFRNIKEIPPERSSRCRSNGRACQGR